MATSTTIGRKAASNLLFRIFEKSLTGTDIDFVEDIDDDDFAVDARFIPLK